MKKFIDIQFLIFIYIGVALMIIPQFFRIDYFPSELISQFGLLIIILGFLSSYNRKNTNNFRHLDARINVSLERYFHYTKSLNEKIGVLEDEGVSNFQILKSRDFKEEIQEFIKNIGYDRTIKIVIDFEHINENVLILIDNLLQVEMLDKLSILITSENEINELNLNNLIELNSKQAFLLNLLNNLIREYGEKVEIKYTKRGNSINMILSHRKIGQLINLEQDSISSVWIVYNREDSSYFKESLKFYKTNWEKAEIFKLK
jgi:hypothetical protein